MMKLSLEIAISVFLAILPSNEFGTSIFPLMLTLPVPWTALFRFENSPPATSAPKTSLSSVAPKTSPNSSSELTLREPLAFLSFESVTTRFFVEFLSTVEFSSMPTTVSPRSSEAPAVGLSSATATLPSSATEVSTVTKSSASSAVTPTVDDWLSSLAYTPPIEINNTITSINKYFPSLFIFFLHIVLIKFYSNFIKYQMH